MVSSIKRKSQNLGKSMICYFLLDLIDFQKNKGKIKRLIDCFINHIINLTKSQKIDDLLFFIRFN